MARIRVTENDLLAALREYGRAAAKRPPGKDWLTMDELVEREIAAGHAVTRAAMRYRLVRAQRNGIIVETAAGTALDDEGRAKRTTYYRLKGTLK